MFNYLNLVILFGTAPLVVEGRHTSLYERENEPKCFSRFDWEDKLLQKVIESDFKLNQHMARLEEMHDTNNAFTEWKRSSAVESEKMRNELEQNVQTLEELREWKTQLEPILTKAGLMMAITYTRWGRTTCPGNGSEAVYAGMAGGSYFTHAGAAASMLCLPEEPDWEAGKYSDAANAVVGYIYGTEYQDGHGRGDQLFGESHHDRDVPCVVCDVKKRSSVLMIPGRSKCYAGWTLEYTGYLMAGHNGHSAATDYYCIDKDPENLPGGEGNDDGHLLYFVEAKCGSLRCPPYVNGREFQCVVCTK